MKGLIVRLKFTLNLPPGNNAKNQSGSTKLRVPKGISQIHREAFTE